MFWLLTTYTDYDSEEAAYDQMEEIAEQFLAKIKADFAARINNRFYSLDQSAISKVGKIGEFIGVRVNLQFFTSANQNLTHNPANWNE